MDVTGGVGYLVALSFVSIADSCVGRVYIATEGINAQVSVPRANLPLFVENLNSRPQFQNMYLNFAVWVFSSYPLLLLDHLFPSLFSRSPFSSLFSLSLSSLFVSFCECVCVRLCVCVCGSHALPAATRLLAAARA